MENFNVIEYNRMRDFSQKMNATFAFIRQNFKALFKSILFIAGPPILVVSLLTGSFAGDMMSMSAFSPGGNSILNRIGSVSFWAEALLIFVFAIIAGVMTLATINNYIVLYGEKRTNKIEVNEVWERVRDTFWMHFGSVFTFGMLFILMYAGIALFAGIVVAISPGFVFLLIFILIPAFLYVAISSSLIFIIRTYESISVLDALGRSFKLVAGKWWSTFGLLMILYLIVGVISYIPLIPFYALLAVNTLHSVESSGFGETSTTMQLFTTIFFSLYYVIYLLLGALPNIGIAFQYFNLVERKEAKGLLNQIENLGRPEDPSAGSTDEHY